MNKYYEQELLVLRAITDSIYDNPSIKGKLSIKEISDLSVSIYTLLNIRGLLNIKTSTIVLKTNPIFTYENYCKSNKVKVNQKYIDIINSATDNRLIGEEINGKLYVVYKGLRTKFIKQIVSKIIYK